MLINLSVQFGKRILFDEVNTTLHMVIFMELSDQWSWESTFLKIISGEMDPTSGHVHLETGKRMSVLSQNHNMFDDIGNRYYGEQTLYSIKKWTSSRL
jgi:ATPase subunit of ABC transporter with duplicated ATPase domains